MLIQCVQHLFECPTDHYISAHLTNMIILKCRPKEGFQTINNVCWTAKIVRTIIHGHFISNYLHTVKRLIKRQERFVITSGQL